ncbi:MAG: nucleotidyltransferase domain-containing protein [Bacteroidales bacterium]|nr:nucleotidyltransferase domain-containing protein [Bacteroidales bacterium]
MITPQQIERITERIVKVYRPDKVILFGSYANGTAKDISDLDLLLVKETNEDPVDRAAVVRLSLRDLLLPMDILVYTPDEIERDKHRKFTFIYHVLKSGKILYARQ